MSIVFGICSWISEKSQIPELERCLESVKGYKVIIVDGKWYDIDSDKLTSISEAFDIYKKYPNVEAVVSINHNEWENRNIYLAKCNNMDNLIVLDTDEYIIQEHTPTLNETVDSFHVIGHDKGKGGEVRLNRGYIFPNESRHQDRHNAIFRNGKKLEFNALCKGITIHHDKSFRSPKREKLMYVRNHLRDHR